MNPGDQARRFDMPLGGFVLLGAALLAGGCAHLSRGQALERRVAALERKLARQERIVARMLTAPRGEPVATGEGSSKLDFLAPGDALEQAEELNTQFKDLLKQARSAYVSGKYRRAIGLARKALAIHPGHTSSLQILGASACFLQDRETALNVAAILEPAQRNFLGTLCKRNQINLTGP